MQVLQNARLISPILEVLERVYPNRKLVHKIDVLPLSSILLPANTTNACDLPNAIQQNPLSSNLLDLRPCFWSLIDELWNLIHHEAGFRFSPIALQLNLIP